MARRSVRWLLGGLRRRAKCGGRAASRSVGSVRPSRCKWARVNPRGGRRARRRRGSLTWHRSVCGGYVLRAGAHTHTHQHIHVADATDKTHRGTRMIPSSAFKGLRLPLPLGGVSPFRVRPRNWVAGSWPWYPPPPPPPDIHPLFGLWPLDWLFGGHSAKSRESAHSVATAWPAMQVRLLTSRPCTTLASKRQHADQRASRSRFSTRNAGPAASQAVSTLALCRSRRTSAAVQSLWVADSSPRPDGVLEHLVLVFSAT